jgi:hypothetical protein
MKEDDVKGTKNTRVRPTPTNPVFTCYCSDYGIMENDFNFFPGWEVHEGEFWMSGDVWHDDLTYAIVDLHRHIRVYGGSSSKTFFIISMVDGSIDTHHNDINRIPCYKISMKDAKKFKII